MASAQPVPVRRGRRDPQLLDAGGPDFDPGEDHADEPTEQIDSADDFYDLLDTGDMITAGFNIPVELEGHTRMSYSNAKVSVRVREGEHPLNAAARAKLATRMIVLTQVPEIEEELRALAEQDAADQARVERAVGQRRTR